MKQKYLNYFLLAVLFFCLTSNAIAITLGGVTIPDKQKLNGTSLLLNGAGLRKATIFGIKVYVGALYLETKSQDSKHIVESTTKKLIALHFVRDVGKEKMVKAWNEGFAKNSKNAADLKTKIDKLNNMMRDIEEPEVLSFAFQKDTVTVSLGGKKQGEIQGADFQAALLRVWLGESPPNEELKKGMLGF